ncbi:hypothetical protein [Methylobacterium nonmethylotrophicum]|uniref:hypothetical protein n=1 Tax=Methylobacterium nonmethylotrophicum TaxID=1141884 RepID=UPI00197B254D|nr:hypothetical protein [Methylobacterium nonmethylotrophicum]
MIAAQVGTIQAGTGRAVRVSVSVEESVLRRIGQAAALRGETRSGILVAAAKARLAEGAATGR